MSVLGASRNQMKKPPCFCCNMCLRRLLSFDLGAEQGWREGDFDCGVEWVCRSERKEGKGGRENRESEREKDREGGKEGGRKGGRESRESRESREREKGHVPEAAAD
eukprot:3677844-Rhodomonas_salina.1